PEDERNIHRTHFVIIVNERDKRPARMLQKLIPLRPDRSFAIIGDRHDLNLASGLVDLPLELRAESRIGC
ncbi:MAG: hypothetical protein WCH79_19755, partial [Planctomycetia bacterium]